MNTKIETKFKSLIQSIRFANSEAKDSSIESLVTKSLDDNSEYSDDLLRFSVVSDYNDELSDLPGDGLRDIKIDDLVDIKSNSILNLVNRKWVIATGEFKGMGFDLSNVTLGKSNMLFGSVMSQVIRLLNKSTGLEVWVDGDKRGKLKDVAGCIQFLLLECEVPRANLHKGLARVYLIIVNFDNHTVSAKSVAQTNINIDKEAEKLRLAIDAVFNHNVDSKAELDKIMKVNNKHHSRDAQSHDAR